MKGYSRLGAALLALGDASEAREAFQKAVALEPNDEILQAQLSKAMAMEEKERASGQHKFKRKRDEGKGKRGGAVVVPITEGFGAKKKQLLSFDDDDEEK